MRAFFIIIVVGALGYLGWIYREELAGRIQAVADEPGSAQTAPAEPAVAPEAAPPPPELVAAPAPKEFAPPGSYYVRQRVSVEMPVGVKALNPGELVKLMYRNNDGTARVSTGKEELVIKESLLTNDPDQIVR